MTGSRDAPLAPSLPGAASLVELWQQEDGMWRWRYLERAHHLVLLSNESYPRREEAERSARVAYPGVPVAERAGPGKPTPSGRAVVVVGATALVLLVVVAITALAVAAAAAVGSAVRRLRHSIALPRLRPSIASRLGR